MAIRVRGLRKAFGKHQVLDGIDIDGDKGTIYSLLGPNGAGKTTTVQILATLKKADAGEIEVAGERDPARIRAKIGVTGQFSAVDDVLTGAENLRMMADLNHLRDTSSVVDGLLARFDLDDARDKPASTYSGGMRRRLDLAMSLVGSPSVIFLDEPTTGLDPRSRHTMWQIIRELVASGVTIFLTTQYLDEADELADRIAVLDNGKIVAEGTPSELKRRLPGGHVLLRFASVRDLSEAAGLVEGGRDDTALTLHVPSDGSARSIKELLDRLGDIEVAEFSVHTPDLDDVFFALTEKEPVR
jgi:ABC-2 type transport system ATP-binding protein